MLEAFGHATRMPSWQRHDILHVAPSAWRAALSSLQLPRTPSLLNVWADSGWPVIVRRRMAREPTNAIPIGVPLPPFAGKCRIAMAISDDDVVSSSAPPLLQNVAHEAPTLPWQRIIREVIHLGAQFGIDPLAFGSLMWQYQTGLAYIGPNSDLDVLWRVPDECDVASLVVGIAGIEDGGPPRIDGEIVFSDGSAVNWRELHNALRGGQPDGLLVKDMESVRLVDLASMLRRG